MKEKDPFDLAEKIFQYRFGELTETERARLEVQLRNNPELKAILDSMSNPSLMERELSELTSYDANNAFNEALESIHPTKQISRFPYQWVAVCIAVLGIIGTVLLHTLSPEAKEYEVLITQQDTTEGVQLLLATGEHVRMDTLSSLRAKEAEFTEENGVLHIHPYEKTLSTAYHKIIVPHKKKYQVVLSDGSKVFLNAGSTLTFPASFGPEDRRVQLEGEAFFEVTHMPHKQFIVEVGKQQVRVYGTVFNIKAYPDDPIHYTTLLEGSISVQGSGKELFLESGTQAQFDQRTGKTLISPANIAMASSWKDGWLAFDNLPLSEILRQIGRWYNLEVEIANTISEKVSATGKILLYPEVNDVLRKFEKLDDIRFDVSENKIIAKQINDLN